MSWFDEQIEMRKAADRDAFEDSFLRIAGAITGQKLYAAYSKERDSAESAIGEILNFYHVKAREVPDKFTTLDEVLEYLLRPYGIMTRDVILEEGWRHNAAGAMLTTFRDNGKPVALIPSVRGGYKYMDSEKGVMCRVTKNAEKLFDDEGITFYKPFPTRKMSMKDFYGYIFENLNKNSLGMYILFALIAAVVGMLIPFLTEKLFSDVVLSRSVGILVGIAIFMVCSSISSVLFGTVQELFLKRLTLELGHNLESATMMRILTLPGDFFKKYASGDLASRVVNISLLGMEMIDMIMSTFVTALFSFAYVFQIFAFAPELASPALISFVVVFLIIIAAIALRTRSLKKQLELQSKESGLSYALLTGIEKIKLSGAEKRAFTKWGKSYSEQAKYLYNPSFLVKAAPALTMGLPLIASVIIYYNALLSNVSLSQYYAFNAAFAMVVTALNAFSAMIEPAAKLKPVMDMLKPIIETEPEVSEEKPVIEKLSGSIELSNISFRYIEDMPPVLDNINLKIRPGQYVAITGKTGCGKSTLMRIMLGFEKPQKGAVYYDGKDLNKVDLKSLRSKIGTVMQNGSLFAGDIYSNIVISAPHLTLEDAWEAARMAGMEEDIKAMPMNMFTIISEGGGGISGGQKQRLMIARAIAPKPKILMFDEATSALDNITQKQVSDSLDGLKCTRVVIAHRLSTIKNCDRIIVLDEGRIVEDGTYDELIAKGGTFAELVKRQQVDNGAG